MDVGGVRPRGLAVSKRDDPLKGFINGSSFLLCKSTEKQRGPSAHKSKGGALRNPRENTHLERGHVGSLLLKDGSDVDNFLVLTPFRHIAP